MKKYFVVSDVHGFYDELMAALDEAGFDIKNPNHIFVSCGDLMDRGQKPAECLDFVTNLPEDRRILVRGNHEDLLEHIMKTYQWNYTDKSNGTYGTICDLTGDVWVDDDTLNRLSRNQILREYLNSLVDYAEIKDYIFVHSWYPWNMENWREASRKEWNYYRWKNPFECWKAVQWHIGDGKEDILAKELDNKTLVFGHWHTSWAHANISGLGIEFPQNKNETIEDCHFEPFYGTHIIGIDGCTAYTHKVNCIILEEE